MPTVYTKPDTEPGTALICTEQHGLPDIPGIDYRIGLKVTGGKIDLYRKLLQRFREQQKDFGRLFRSVARTADPLTAILVTHRLKGVAANLGIVGVKNAAANLEAACRSFPEAVDERLEKLLEELGRVVRDLELSGIDAPDHRI